MKLVDFLTFEPFNRLKSAMGIPHDVYGSFSVEVGPPRLTDVELNALTSGDGIDVSFDELTILDDHTLTYKGARVLLYIRDVTEMGSSKQEPRYHLANCRTLQSMTAAGKFEKYVIAAEVTGTFLLNIISGSARKSERRRLRVCQNCLDDIALDGFSLDDDRHERYRYVSGFTPDRFFEEYPRSLHIHKPGHTSLTAPLNEYGPEFREVSRTLRRAANWKCESCSGSYADPRLRRYLHVHHKNGLKWDNSRRNLAVLCLGCHAETPNHGHLKGGSDYLKYLLERPAAA